MILIIIRGNKRGSVECSHLKKEKKNKQKKSGNNWHLCLFVKYTQTQYRDSFSLTLEALLLRYFSPGCIADLPAFSGTDKIKISYNPCFWNIFSSLSHKLPFSICHCSESLLMVLDTWTSLLFPLLHLLGHGIIYRQLWKNSNYHNNFAYLAMHLLLHCKWLFII